VKYFFYFPEDYTSYTLKSLINKDLKDDEVSYKHDDTEGKLRINLCNNVKIPKECEDTIKEPSGVLLIK
jgi:hypothetical protein